MFKLVWFSLAIVLVLLAIRLALGIAVSLAGLIIPVLILGGLAFAGYKIYKMVDSASDED